MSLIKLSSVSKSFGAEDLFRDVTLSIARGARLAIVGPNGIGKTTLLRILAGEEEATSGSATRAKGLRVGYLPQEADFELRGVLWDVCLEPFAELRSLQVELERLEHAMAEPQKRDGALSRYGPLQEEFHRRGGYTYAARIKEVLGGLGFSSSEFHLALDHLSGGQRTRAHLARLLLMSPDVLLLDEPTNHLDVEAVEWLESHLEKWEGAAVVVSHDRYFLDRACNAILEMGPAGTEFYRGNYSQYLVERENRWTHRQEVFEKERAALLKEVGYVKKHIAGQNTLQAKGKLKRLTRTVQAIEQVGMEAAVGGQWSQLGVETTTSPFSVAEAELRVRGLRPPRRTSPDLRLHLRASDRSGDLVLRTRKLEVGFPGKLLFRAPDIELRRGGCAALLGPNGAGKSTLLKTVLGQLPPLAGEVELGASVAVGYFAQAHEGLDSRHSVMEEILAASPGMLPYQARDYLGKYAFSGDDVFKRVEMLSGGERGRLALAKLALKESNLLLLDEPTNHLDIPAQESLQSVLAAYAGTILLVTHDRYLVDALATQIWEIDAAQTHLDVFRGTYSELKEARGRGPAQIKATVPSSPSQPKRGRATSADARAERRRIAQLQELENTIARLEGQLAELGIRLEQPPAHFAETEDLGRQYAGIQQRLDDMLAQWERLQALGPGGDVRAA